MKVLINQICSSVEGLGQGTTACGYLKGGLALKRVHTRAHPYTLMYPLAVAGLGDSRLISCVPLQRPEAVEPQ